MFFLRKNETFIYIYDILLRYIPKEIEMGLTYKGKPIIPAKKVLDELSEIDLKLYEVSCILENGFLLRKRKKNIVERNNQCKEV